MEKSEIVQQLNHGKTIKQISAIATRDPLAITRFLDPLMKTVHRDQGKMKALSTRGLSIIVSHQLKKMPTISSTIIFLNTGLPIISKSTRRLAKHVKPEVRPLLKDIHKEKRMAWAQKYLKLNF